MPTKVKVLSSPYYAVKRGARGHVVGVRHEETRYEVLRVEFPGGESRLFHPCELEIINAP